MGPGDVAATLGIAGVGIAALVVTKVLSDAATAIVCGCLVSFFPAALILPASWKGVLDADVARARATRLLPGGIAGVLIAPVKQTLGAAIVLGIAGAYMTLASFSWWRRSKPSGLWLVRSVCSCAIFGVVADVPNVLGWHTVGFSVFGAGAYVAIATCRSPKQPETLT
jgi:hypothetical protein